MSEKKAMPLGELEALIKDELCSDDEAIRQQAQAKLLEEGSEAVADRLARASGSSRLESCSDLIIETLMQLPLNIKVKGLRYMTVILGDNPPHPYQEVAKKALREAIQLFKEKNDTINLLNIARGSASHDIIELALKTLEELGEKPNVLTPYPYKTQIVDSIKDVRIDDDWVRCNVSIDRSTKVFTANFCVEAGVIQPVKIKGKTEDDYKEEREYIQSQGFEEASSRDDGEFIFYWFKRSLSDEQQAKVKNDAVLKLVKNLRKGASQQEKRIDSALMLGEILEDDKLINAAKKLRPISGPEVRFVALDSLRQRDGHLWDILDQALDVKGYPPATTLEENMIGRSRSSGEQVVRWFGEEAAEYVREVIETSPYIQQKCAEILSILGKSSDVPLLVNVLSDDKDPVQASAITALGNIGTPEAFQAIIQHSEGEQVGSLTMRGIATALGNYDDPASILILTRLLETDPLSAKNAGMSLIKLGHSDAVIQVMENHDKKYFQTLAAQALAESSSDTPNDK